MGEPVFKMAPGACTAQLDPWLGVLVCQPCQLRRGAGLESDLWTCWWWLREPVVMCKVLAVQTEWHWFLLPSESPWANPEGPRL